MTSSAYQRISLGSQIAALTLPPVDRTTLALFAGASGDHNPIHIDIDFARRAKQPDVFAHGMLSMAWLGRLLTNWMPQAQLKNFTVRFQGITHIGHVITCGGTVAEKLEIDGLPSVRLQIQTTNQYGETLVAGEAWVAFPAT
ncbi:MaoC family dehydratase [Bradyrhizobium tropiciagri]|uniref:MaoC family dehydratase n=1 Tax=Bradyrhizobium tropiciagri TaxID=312253 RepID=UPI001BA502F5|nr:MaoC family dehydratase [Bradyrhizobium tropiciagri]MBR0898971.1 MaoC family dehydratase [Bradyrhizobium tropiciagri]